MLRPAEIENKKKAALYRRYKKDHARNLASVKKMFPKMKEKSDKPLFNPKARIDQSQIENR
jgi:hypothetical protein